MLWVYTVFSAGLELSMQFQLWGNFVVYLGLLGYLSWPLLERRLKHLFLPIGLAIASIFPVLSNFIYLLAPSHVSIDIIISRSWLWLPILFVPLVLISWQYKFKAVLAFTILTNGLELIVLLNVIDKLTYETIPLIGVPLIRAFAFGVVGYIVNILIETQRMQNQKLILSNIRLNQYSSTLEQLATSRERNRLATELHDTLAHTLSGLSINLEAIKTVLPENQSEAQAMLDLSLLTTRMGLDETRRALRALRAGPLEDLGLKMALAKLAQSASDRLNIPIEFECPEQIPILPFEIEQSLYRITQESLENIINHADAAKAEVAVDVSPEKLMLTIRDDGIGFDLSKATKGERYGLQGLQERATSVGGKVIVESNIGVGTTVQFLWERKND